MHIADQIQAQIEANHSIACIGLDPRPHLIPSTVKQRCLAEHGDTPQAVGAAFSLFNRSILEAVAGHCAAIKPQVACYEAYGIAGMQALEESLIHARALNIPIILDGKRNDIGSTAAHYQQAWLGTAPGLGDDSTCENAWRSDWLTVNGYLGSDGIEPFLDPQSETGIFVLVKTSNPSSADLQGQKCGDEQVMHAMAKLVHQWGSGREGACGLTDVGAVVGATWPAEAQALRTLMPNTLFLVPGYGAQGGTAADALAGQRSDGTGLLINSSRAILAAWQQEGWADDDWAGAARAALEAMNDDLNAER